MKNTSTSPNSADPTTSSPASANPGTPPGAPEDGGKNLQRYLVILADRFRHLEECYGYRMFDYGFYTSAYVLAANQQEAMVRACDWLSDKDFRPIAVWTPEMAKEILHALETIPLSPTQRPRSAAASGAVERAGMGVKRPLTGGRQTLGASSTAEAPNAGVGCGRRPAVPATARRAAWFLRQQTPHHANPPRQRMNPLIPA